MPPAAQTQGFYLVLTRPVAGREAAYHVWYDQVHVPQILAIGGVRFARRFALDVAGSAPTRPEVCAAVYGLDDVQRAMTELRSRRGTQALTSSDTVDREASRFCVFDAELTCVRQACAGDSLWIRLLDDATLAALPPNGRFFRASARQASDAPAAFAGAVLAVQDAPTDQAAAGAEALRLVAISPLQEAA